MITKPAHKDTVNPPGQIVNNFEVPVRTSVDNYYKERCAELEREVDQLRSELKYERGERLYWFFLAGGVDNR